jgi:CHRD domain
MRRLILCLSLLLVVSTSPMAMADDDNHNRSHRIRVHLSGFNEVHFSGGSFDSSVVPPFTAAALRGAISTGASGTFVARIDEHDDIIHYKLSYKNLEGTVTQGHIHFGQRHTVGGIVVWLCQTSTNPAPATVAALTPTCPGPSAQVLPQILQGIEEGAFDELVRAILAGAAYANVHSSLFTPGEIRGQIPGKGDDHKD